MEQSVSAFAFNRVLVLHKYTTIQMAACAMSDRKVGSVLVSDKGKMVGIVTDRDISSRAAASAMSTREPLEKIMSQPLLAVADTAMLNDVVNLMIESGVRRVPIIANESNGSQRCVGIITLDDLLVSGLVSPLQLKLILKNQVLSPAAALENNLNRGEVMAFIREFEETLGPSAPVLGFDLTKIAERILQIIFKRLPYTAALHLVQKLPAGLRTPLLGLGANPDLSLESSDLLLELEQDFQILPTWTREYVRSCWSALHRYLSVEDKEYVIDRLPLDFKALLAERTFRSAQAIGRGPGETPAGYGAT